MFAGDEKIRYRSEREFGALNIHDASARFAEYQQDSRKLSSPRARSHDACGAQASRQLPQPVRMNANGLD